MMVMLVQALHKLIEMKNMPGDYRYVSRSVQVTISMYVRIYVHECMRSYVPVYLLAYRSSCTMKLHHMTDPNMLEVFQCILQTCILGLLEW